MGQGTENPLSTQAVTETRGIIATYQNQPINALYSSTCGGRTEDAENIFDEKVPVSGFDGFANTSIRSRVPFSTSRSFPDWKDAVLAVAGVSNFTRGATLHGLAGTRRAVVHGSAGLAAFIRESFYPAVLTTSDVSFVTEQGILPPSGSIHGQRNPFPAHR